jgi:hypothetical protein
VSLLIACLINHLIPYSANIVVLTSEGRKLVEDAFKLFGPVPRFCIDYVLDEELRAHDAECRSAASHITAQSLRRINLEGGELDIDAESHKIFMVRRNKVDDLQEAYVEPVSPYIETLLMKTIDTLQRLERIALYHTFASVNSTRVLAGLIFESLGHMRFVEGVELSLRSMTRKKARKLVHWKQGNVDDSHSIDFPPNPSIVFEVWPTSIEPNYLYLPRANNHVAFDSFFLLGTTLYFFQFTISDSHDISDGIKDYLSGQLRILPPKENWRYVFITPPGCEVDVKSSSETDEFLEGVDVYLAHLEA